MTSAYSAVRSFNDSGTATAALRALQAGIAGTVHTRESADYDAYRSTLYIHVDRRPLAVVRVATVDDVVTTVNFARERGYPLAVRSGGHSMAHLSVVDGAIVVDFSEMKQVQIDPVSRIARVQAGATSDDVATPAGNHGLALSTGDTRSVGIGGLTTGGGIGLMVRKFGLAIDNLLSAQVVTAHGDILTASEESNADIFWAIRGGGGNAGIVTEFVFRLAPVANVLGGILMLPATPEVVRGYLSLAASAPDELTTIGELIHLPPEPFVPEDQVGDVALSILATWAGERDEGEEVLDTFRSLATPIADFVDWIPYPDMYQFSDQATQPHAASVRSMFAHELSDELIEAAIEGVRQSSTPYSFIQFRVLGGAMARVDVSATAFAHRKQQFFVAIIGLWLDADEDPEPHRAWTSRMWDTIRHEGSGVYVNFLEDEGQSRVHDAYPPATYDRLAEIKRRYDPTNLFRFNQNIRPHG